jgi:thiol-disulfide isomerase/thioredoxin
MSESESILAKLTEYGIVEPSDDGIRVTERLEEEMRRQRRSRSDRIEEDIVGLVGELTASRLSDEEKTELLAIWDALAVEDGAISDEERRKLLVVVDSLLQSPPAAGAPDGFLPIRGNRLAFFAGIYQHSVAYVWKHDCDPCDAMRENLEEVFDDPDTDVMKFAVYGPDSASFLQDTYDVAGAPTLLYLAEGTVDVRLVGLRSPDLIEVELHNLRDQA